MAGVGVLPEGIGVGEAPGPGVGAGVGVGCVPGLFPPARSVVSASESESPHATVEAEATTIFRNSGSCVVVDSR